VKGPFISKRKLPILGFLHETTGNIQHFTLDKILLKTRDGDNQEQEDATMFHKN
jgi:hypothetical protein